jgi:hypothetical protein
MVVNTSAIPIVNTRAALAEFAFLILIMPLIAGA